MVGHGDEGRDSELPIDAPRPASEVWWEDDPGPSAWDGFAPAGPQPGTAPDDRSDSDDLWGPSATWGSSDAAGTALPGLGGNSGPPLVWQAVASVIVGLIGLIACNIILGPVAIGFGVRARSLIREAPPGMRRGEGAAIAGIALGAVGALIGVVRFALIVMR